MSALSRVSASHDLQREWDILKARRNRSMDDRYEVLDARDRIVRSRLKSQEVTVDDDTVVVRGNCAEICPEKERYERLKQNRVDTLEENGHMVKDFSRQAADQDMPLPSELRTEATLRATMDYLLREIIRRTPDNPENPAGWYDFVWRRLRAIRKEITQQRLTGATIASILEDQIRFHLVSCHMFCEADRNQFDQKLNLEAVNDCLATLSRIYAEMSEENAFSENVAEMRSYEMLLRIWTDKLDLVKITSLLLQLPSRIQASHELTFARKVVSACNSRLYSEYISLLRQADYVTACLMHYYLPMVQARTLHHLAVSSGSRSKGSVSLPVEFVQSTFGLNTQEELQVFCSYHGLDYKEGEAMINFNAGSAGRRDPKTFPRIRSFQYVESKIGGRNLAEIIARKKFSTIAVPLIVETNSFEEDDVYGGEDPWTCEVSNVENIPPLRNKQAIGASSHFFKPVKTISVSPYMPASIVSFKTQSPNALSNNIANPASFSQNSVVDLSSPVLPNSAASINRFGLKRTSSRFEQAEDGDVVYLGSKRPHAENSLRIPPIPLRIPSFSTERLIEKSPSPSRPVAQSPSKTVSIDIDEKIELDVQKDYPVRTHLNLVRARAVCHAGGTMNAVFKAWREYSHSIRQPTHYFGQIDATLDQVKEAETFRQDEMSQWLWAKFPVRSFIRETGNFDVCVLLFLYIDSQSRRRNRLSQWIRTKLGDPCPEEDDSSVRILTFTENEKELCVVFVNVLESIQTAHAAVANVRDSVGALCIYCTSKSDLSTAESFRASLSDRCAQTAPLALFCQEADIAEEDLEGLPGNLVLNVAVQTRQPSIEVSFALWDSIKLLLRRRIPSGFPQSLTLLQIVSQLYCDFIKLYRSLQIELKGRLSDAQRVQLWNSTVTSYLEDRNFILDQEECVCDWLREKLSQNQLCNFLQISDNDNFLMDDNAQLEVFPVGSIIELTTGTQKSRDIFANISQKMTIVTAAASVYDPVTGPGTSSQPLPDFELLLKNHLEEFESSLGSNSTSESDRSSNVDDDDNAGQSGQNYIGMKPYRLVSDITASSRGKQRTLEPISDAFHTVRQTHNVLSEWFTEMSSLLSDLDSL